MIHLIQSKIKYQKKNKVQKNLSKSTTTIKKLKIKINNFKLKYLKLYNKLKNLKKLEKIVKI